MSPARLHHADSRISKIMHEIAENSLTRNEISIKNQQEISRARRHSGLQGTRLVADPIFPVKVNRVET